MYRDEISIDTFSIDGLNVFLRYNQLIKTKDETYKILNSFYVQIGICNCIFSQRHLFPIASKFLLDYNKFIQSKVLLNDREMFTEHNCYRCLQNLH